MGQVQATENILCPGAHSLEPCCTPEPRMHTLIVGSTLQTESDLLLNMKLGAKNSKLFNIHKR